MVAKGVATHMARHYLALNGALIFWLLALLCWSYSATLPAQIFGGLALLNFILHAFSHQVNSMFKKKQIEEISPLALSQPAPAAAVKEPPAPEKHATTIIASDVCFEGNIQARGHVYIHGTLKGNIDAQDNLIKVMRGGVVEGNIVCRELIIDGRVNGECSCDAVDICDNGQVTGTLTYRTLAVKKGGIFSGQAEMMKPLPEASNIVGFLTETADEQAKKSQHAAG